jgi:ribonuclease HII
MKKLSHYIIGIDEVGRGALAGPVVVSAAAVPKSAWRMLRNAERILGKLKDSKKLSSRKREAWVGYFKKYPSIIVMSARIYPRGIEKMNISAAANKAALNAYARLIAINEERIGKYAVFLDGGLYLGNGKGDMEKEKLKKEIKNAETVIKGDEKITAIKIASIVAKVSRDNYMSRLSKKYPEYGFDIHKGYGTKAHFRAIRKYGSSSVHRKSFLSSCHYPPFDKLRINSGG